MFREMVSSAREAIDLNKKAGNKREDQLIDRDRPISLFFVIDEVGVYVHSPFTKNVLTTISIVIRSTPNTSPPIAFVRE